MTGYVPDTFKQTSIDLLEGINTNRKLWIPFLIAAYKLN